MILLGIILFIIVVAILAIVLLGGILIIPALDFIVAALIIGLIVKIIKALKAKK